MRLTGEILELRHVALLRLGYFQIRMRARPAASLERRGGSTFILNGFDLNGWHGLGSILAALRPEWELSYGFDRSLRYGFDGSLRATHAAESCPSVLRSDFFCAGQELSRRACSWLSAISASVWHCFSTGSED